jgi:hypothetical protein
MSIEEIVPDFIYFRYFEYKEKFRRLGLLFSCCKLLVPFYGQTYDALGSHFWLRLTGIDWVASVLNLYRLVREYDLETHPDSVYVETKLCSILHRSTKYSINAQDKILALKIENLIKKFYDYPHY